MGLTLRGLLACLLVSTTGVLHALELEFRAAVPPLEPAAQEYAAIWARDGTRIVASLQDITGVRLAESRIVVVVHEARSESGIGDAPMKLRASYSEPVKRGTLVHELGHRYLEQLRPARSALDTHQQLALILVPAWTRLWGGPFVRAQIAVEAGWSPTYRRAWDWFGSLGEAQRSQALQELRGPTRSEKAANDR